MNVVSRFSAITLKKLVGVDGELKSLNDLWRYGIKVFDKTTYNNLPSFQAKDVGVVYAIEMGDKVKIGFSTNPLKRYKSFIGNSRYGNIELGRIAISKFHFNYKENEKQLHSLFKKYRKTQTELFDISLIKATTQICKLHFDIEGSLRDNTPRRVFVGLCTMLGMTEEDSYNWFEELWNKKQR